MLAATSVRGTFFHDPSARADERRSEKAQAESRLTLFVKTEPAAIAVRRRDRLSTTFGKLR
jgi:hypothetical protein